MAPLTFTKSLLALSPASLLFSAPTNTIPACSPGSITFPTIFGAEVLSLEAAAVFNHSGTSLQPGTNKGGLYTASFCNVTVLYTHRGWNDTIKTQVWLPLENWNGKLHAVGGGGYSTGFGTLYLTSIVSEGYVSAETDGGHVEDDAIKAGAGGTLKPEWVVNSPGNLNLHLLEDYGEKALNELGIISKQVTKSFYGTSPTYSYFSGCSVGGRQGFMLAQRYPSTFDGIMAAAPAINLQRFIPSGFYAGHIMNTLDYIPAPCEIEGFTAAAVSACDDLDGIDDGIISDASLCNFSAASVVGQPFSCNGLNKTFSSPAAEIVQAAWDGPPGPYGWPGLSKDASLTASYITTTCLSDSNTTDCSAASSALLVDFITYFILANPDFDTNNITTAEFLNILHLGKVKLESSLASADPDLSAFKALGGKMISWQGVADETVPIRGTVHYYDDVLEHDAQAGEFFKFFEAPGVGHCTGNPGAIPNEAFARLVDWVERGEEPEVLIGDMQEGAGKRTICPYPKKQIYVGGNITVAESFECM